MKSLSMILNLKNNSVVVFDLDDTLYNEIDFLKSAFQHIAKKFCPSDINNAYNQLLVWFSKETDPFDNLIKTFNLKNRGIDKTILINEYRTHSPKITLRKGADELLLKLKKNKIPVGLITDGRSLTQRNKLKALGLSNFFDLVIISQETGSEKPAHDNYLAFHKKFPNSEYYYFGDNTQKDFITPNLLGWTTICYLDPGINIHKQSFDLNKEYLPDFVIRDFGEVQVEKD